ITAISQSPLNKNPIPKHLSKLQPINTINTKKQFFHTSFKKNPKFQIQLNKQPLSPKTSQKTNKIPYLNPKQNLTLLSPIYKNPTIKI
uniref:hypothetical protein n=1 Tax=Klebsiella pneumoniae TaxID=573 RepID=UPI003EBC7767